MTMHQSVIDSWVPIGPGMRRRTVAVGREMTQVLLSLDAGARMAEHSHPHEEVCHVLSGRVRVRVNGMVHDLSAGDSLCIERDTPHSADAFERSMVVDTFSPPRDAFLS